MTGSRGYPIVLELAGHVAVIVGGGSVGTRKARALFESGAELLIVAPDATAELEELAADEERVRLFRREFQSGDLVGATLAFAATDDADVNAAVVREGRKRGVLVNCAAGPGGDFVVPASTASGDVGFAVWTGSPALTARLCGVLGESVDERWERASRIMSELRPVVADQARQATRAEFWRRVAAGAPEQFRTEEAAREFVSELAREFGLDVGEPP